MVILVHRFLLASLILSSSYAAAQPEPPPNETARAIEQLVQENAALEEKLRLVGESLDRQAREHEADVAETARRHALDDQQAEKRFEVPAWITGAQDHSDLRLRFDDIHSPESHYASRRRYRPRLRLGAIVELEHDFEIGVRLASAPTIGQNSGGDPLSNNQTFEDNGSRKPVGIDWAFVRWTPLHVQGATTSIAVGKLENPPNFTEDIFDVDYTPEGAAETLAYRRGAHAASLYLGQYILDELSTSPNDPFLLVEQLHVDSKWNAQVATAFTASALNIGHPESLTSANVPDVNHGNTRDASGALANKYEVFVGDASVTFSLAHLPGYRGPFPIKLYGEYIHNFGAATNNIGYSAGPTFGSVSQRNSNITHAQRGNWELSFRIQKLEGDATYEELTGSENGAPYRSSPPGEPAPASFRPTFLNGLNVRGYTLRLAYAPLDFLVVDARLWRNEAIAVADDAERVKGTRFVIDFIWRL